MLCLPDGTPIYRHTVGVAANEVTDVNPLAAYNDGVSIPPAQVAQSNVPPVAYLPAQTPAPVQAYGPQVRPAEQGNLKLNTPWAMRHDALFIDGTYVGLAGRNLSLMLTPGTHNIALCDRDGNTDYQQDVGIALNQTTILRPSLNG